MEKKDLIPGLVPQKDGSVAIFIEVKNGACLSSAEMELLSQVVQATRCRVHLTPAQKLMLIDLDEERGKQAVAMLKDSELYVKTVRDLSSPRVCVGTPYCKYAQQDTFGLSDFLMERLARKPIAKKMKVGIAGCPACCSWANCLDLGFVGVKSGWQVYIGGQGGAKPRSGKLIGKISDFQEAADILEKVAELFNQEVKIKSRVGRLMNKLGEDEFLHRIGLSSRG